MLPLSTAAAVKKAIVADHGEDAWERVYVANAAAERVELVLPETGVCSSAPASDASNCCGGPALADVDACCVADEKAKQQGKTGCGCASWS